MSDLSVSGTEVNGTSRFPWITTRWNSARRFGRKAARSATIGLALAAPTATYLAWHVGHNHGFKEGSSVVNERDKTQSAAEILIRADKDFNGKLSPREALEFLQDLQTGKVISDEDLNKALELANIAETYVPILSGDFSGEIKRLKGEK